MLNKLAIYLIKFYQFAISPWFGNCCKFHPSCSEYALLSFKKYNSFKASFLTIKRLIKCAPWHKGGIDYP